MYMHTYLVCGHVVRLGNELDSLGSDNGRGMKFFIFLFSTMARLALGPTQPSVQWVLGFLPRG